MNRDEKATKDSWQTLPMPWRHATARLGVRMSLEDFETIEMGHIPAEMEDRWFMYCDEEKIRWYRSWSGICIFEAGYTRHPDYVSIDKLVINRNPKQYSCTDKAADINLFLTMIAWEIGTDPKQYWKVYWDRTK